MNGSDLESEVEVEERRVYCDGGGGTLGHPGVYLTIEDDRIACPYCSRGFVLKEGAGKGGGH